MAFTLIGGTAVGTVLTLLFLPALYSIWFGVKPTAVPSDETQAFLPNALPEGIEPEDPMINVRSAAYPISYERRQ